MISLYLIPSPISNPFSLRDHLEACRFFVVENVREARRFLRWNFKTIPIDDCHFLEINKNQLDLQAIQLFLQQAKKAGADVGLMSDAGVPCVADPGSQVVEKAHQLGILIKPLVGPSSILLALMGSGFNGQHFSFHGYLPISENELIKKIRQLEEESFHRNSTQIFIETPYRNNKTLELILKSLRQETRVCVACDLNSDREEIISKKVKDWNSKDFDFHKRPAVFLIYAH